MHEHGFFTVPCDQHSCRHCPFTPLCQPDQKDESLDTGTAGSLCLPDLLYFTKAEGKKYGPAPAQKAMVPASDAELLGKTDKEKEEEKKKACKGCPDEAKKSLMEMTAGPGVKSATKKAEAKDEDEEKKKEKLARVIKEGTEVKKCSVEAGGFFPHHYDQNNPDKKWHEDFVGTTWEAEAKQLELDYAGIQLGITRMRLLAEKADLRRRELEMLFDAAKAAVGAK